MKPALVLPIAAITCFALSGPVMAGSGEAMSGEGAQEGQASAPADAGTGADETAVLAISDPGDITARAVTARKNYVCNGTGQTICRFLPGRVRVGARVFTFPDRAYGFRKTMGELVFIDATGREWRAPAGTLTDGASIPPLFTEIIGDPNSPEFASAAAIHDAYCGYGNEKGESYQTRAWRDVHRVFYEALVVGGTPVDKAKTMYSAVLLGGPRWNPGGTRTLVEDWGGHARADLADVAPEKLSQAMQDIAAYIEAENPDPDAIEDLVNLTIARMKGR